MKKFLCLHRIRLPTTARGCVLSHWEHQQMSPQNYGALSNQTKKGSAFVPN